MAGAFGEQRLHEGRDVLVIPVNAEGHKA